LLVFSLPVALRRSPSASKAGLIGAGPGRCTGAIIGSTVGHATVGALIGGSVGLIAGALIGDQRMGQAQRAAGPCRRERAKPTGD